MSGVVQALCLIGLDDQDSTQTITSFGSGQQLSLINRSSVDITFTVKGFTATLPAGSSWEGRVGLFSTFTVTCPGSEDWSYAVYG